MAKRSNNRIIYILLGLVVLLLLVVVGARKSGVIGKAKELEVEVTTAKRITITETVTASGTVQPQVEIAISPEVSGEIIELTVEEGDSVTKGDLLVRLNPEIFVQRVKQGEASLNQAKANAASSRAALARAKANLERQELDFARQEKLHDQGVISQADWEQAQANIKVARQDLEAAEQNTLAADYSVDNAFANLQDARENLNRSSIYAPNSGTVSKLNVEQGETVVGTSQMAGTEMMRIADLMAMEVRVDVNENDIIRVHVGDTAIIDVDSYAPLEKQFLGVVTAIANTANDKVSADAVTEFEVKIRILNSSYADLLEENPGQPPFRPGMTASVDIQTKRKANVLSVPLAAVTTRAKSVVERAKTDAVVGEGGDDAGDKEEEEEELECVFVIDANNNAQLVEVTTGVKDFDNIEITSGLTDGDRIISGPYLEVSRRLKDGDLVKDKSAKPEAATSDDPAEE